MAKLKDGVPEGTQYLPYAGGNRNSIYENPFAGTMYESLWENNPYRDLYYEPNFWDKIGLSNKAKDANSEYDRLYNEYIAGIYQMQEQDKYNSPANQAKLEREAGLNPDITGISGSGESSGLTPPNAGINPALNGQSPVISGISTISQVLSFATSTLHQIETIKGLSLSNTDKDLSNFQKFVDYARPHIVNEYAKRFSGNKGSDWSDVMNVSASSFYSRSEQNQYKKAFQYLLGSSDFTASEQAYKNMSANDMAMKHFMSGMVDYEIQSKKSGFQSQISQNKYNSSYFGGLDAKSAFEATNRENNNRGWLDKWRNDLYRTLYNDFKKGSTLAGLILIGCEASFGKAARLDISRSDFMRNLKKFYSEDWEFQW